jgi:hypothetical protein
MEDKMKKNWLVLANTLFLSSLLLSGCHKFHEGDDYYNDYPPAAPVNVYTITGDNRVDIYWDANREHDVAGYNVYYSYSYNGKYTLIGHTTGTHYIDYGARNGVTYYYAITTYNYSGLESDLSKDVIYDTPRPEGFNQSIFDYNTSPSNSGYEFSAYLILPYNDKNTDFFFEKDANSGQYYLNVWSDSDIQDMGTTSSIYDIDYAPTSGWVPLVSGDNVKYTRAIAGHTYVIWTFDDHYAKVRITSISGTRMVFDWAYQTVAGNKELKRGTISKSRSKTFENVIKLK